MNEIFKDSFDIVSWQNWLSWIDLIRHVLQPDKILKSKKKEVSHNNRIILNRDNNSTATTTKKKDVNRLKMSSMTADKCIRYNLNDNKTWNLLIRLFFLLWNESKQMLDFSFVRTRFALFLQRIFHLVQVLSIRYSPISNLR